VSWFNGFNLRSALFGVGAIGAVATAIDIAQREGVTLTPAHYIALGCTALVAYAMKWPSDVTGADAREIEARALRRSIAPPPGSEPAELIEVPGPYIAPRAPRREDEHGP
jgi:hypothetical protein